MNGMHLVRLSLLVTALGVSGNAWAQGAAGNADAESSVRTSSMSGDQIIVTARRREESLQDVPVSVTALDAETLNNRSIQDLSDLSRVSPGLRFGNEGGKVSASLSLRGLAQTPISNSTPGVVTYFAEVPLPAEGSNLATYDLASIQVLKGPQGTLFGRTTLGGAVLVEPVAPTRFFEGYVEATYGRFDYRELEGAINLPLGEFGAIRAAGQIRRRDGITRRLDGGGRFDTIDQDSARVSLLLEPTSTLSNTTIFDYFHQDETAAATYLLSINENFAPIGPLLVAPFQAQQDEGFWAGFGGIGGLGVAFNENWGIVNRTELELGAFTIRNIFGYRERHVEQVSNTGAIPTLLIPTGGDPIPFTLFSAAATTRAKQITEEFQVQGDFGNVDAIVGAFYSLDKPNGPTGSAFKAFSPDFVPRVQVTNLFEGESFAIYGQVSIDLTERLGIDIGGRYTWETAEACGGTFPDGAGLTEFVGLDRCVQAAEIGDPTDGFGTVKAKSDDYNYTFAINYDVNDDVLVYATTRRGVRPAAVNVPLFETRFTTGGMDPGCQFADRGIAAGTCIDLRPFQTTSVEVLTDYEVGLKSQFAVGPGEIRFNIAAFYNDYNNALQLLTTTPGLVPTSGVPDTPSRGGVAVNVADLTIWGIELDAAIMPTDNVTFFFTGAYTESEVDRINVPQGGFAFPQSLVTLPTPTYSGTAAVDWTMPFRVAGGEVVFNADIFVTDDFSGQSGVSLPGYSVSNARIEVRDIGGSGADIAVFVRNLFDAEYFVGPSLLSTTQPINSAFKGDPRTWGLTLRYAFGR